MRILKVFLLSAAAGALALSCSQGPGTNGSGTGNSTQAGSTPAVATTPGGPVTVLTPNTGEADVKGSSEPGKGMGKEIYANNCMICHRDTGKGGSVTMSGKTINPDDLTSEKIKKMSDEKLIGYVTNGIEDEGMPAFKDKLKPEDIKAVVAHVRELQKSN